MKHIIFYCKKFYALILLALVLIGFIVIVSQLFKAYEAITVETSFEQPENFFIDNGRRLAKPDTEYVTDESASAVHAFLYRDVDEAKLISWLEEKDSMLADKKYFDIVYNVAEQKNVDVILLISILGQEQGFVPHYHEQAHLIINNPFNVYGSWKEYNTDLSDSAAVAANTIIRLRSDLPENENAFLWLNTHNNDGSGYAEDENWWKGVSYFYEEINNILETEGS